MLVLSRRSGEQVLIGKEIVVTVLEVRGGRVKLGSLGRSKCRSTGKRSSGSPQRLDDFEATPRIGEYVTGQ